VFNSNANAVLTVAVFDIGKVAGNKDAVAAAAL
jgi:hypothetical protein